MCYTSCISVAGCVCEGLPRPQAPHQPAHHPLLHDADDRYNFCPYPNEFGTIISLNEFWIMIMSTSCRLNGDSVIECKFYGFEFTNFKEDITTVHMYLKDGE